MMFRKKRAQSVSLDEAREELQRSQERERDVTRVVTKLTKIIEDNHIAPRIRNALR